MLDPQRFKNYGLWVSVASLILILLQTFGVPVVPAQYDEIVNIILSILVAAGIINNPTTENKGFGDDKVEDNKGEEEVTEENNTL